jgi:dipeptidyl aminopeptidase/acylaminoacyl peptidase
MLLFQGTADNLVPWRQAVVMAEALTNAKVKGRIELFPGVGHGLPKSEARHAYDVSWKFLAETLNQP